MSNHSSLRQQEEEAFLKKLRASSSVISNLPRFAIEAVQGIGLETAEIESSQAPLNEKNLLAAWCCLYEARNQVWIDIMVEADRIDAAFAFRMITDSKSAELSDSLDLLGEIANFVRGALKGSFHAEYAECLTPGVPKPVPGGNIHVIHSYPCARVRVPILAGEVRMVVTFLFNEEKPRVKTPATLREFDMTVEAISAADESCVPWVARGVVLSSKWIDKLRARCLKETTERQIKVVTPPKLTAMFHPEFAQSVAL